MQMLNSPDEEDRLSATMTVAEKNHTEYLPALVSRLKIEPSRPVKEALVIALSKLLMDDLIRKLNSEDESERCFAAQDLGDRNRPEYLEILVARLKIERSRIVKEALVVALGKLDNVSRLETVIHLFSSKEAFLRNAATTILKKIGTRAIPQLLATLDHSDPDIRKFALDTLNVIEAELSQAIYGKMLKDPDLNIRITAVEYVGLNCKYQFRSLIEQNFLDSQSTLLTSACLETLFVVGNRASHRIILERYPRRELVPIMLQDLWLRIGERWPLEEPAVANS